MHTLSRSVVGVAGGILVLCAVGTVSFFSAFANQHGSSIPARNEAFPAISAHEPEQDSDMFILAQGGGATGSSGGGMAGGFGFGGGLSGGMVGGGFASSSSIQGQQKEIVLKWEKPTTSPPAWLEPKAEINQAEEKLRKILDERGEVNFNAMQLSGVIKYFRNLLDIPIIIDEKALEEMEITPDEPITLELPAISFRDSLSLILKPLGLTYVINKECMVITDHQSDWGPIRYYDVSYMLPDNGLTNEIISTIESMISPTRWQTGGGSYSIRSIGSMLVVKADEETNFEIERMLSAISKQTPANLKQRVFVEKPASKPTESEKTGEKR